MKQPVFHVTADPTPQRPAARANRTVLLIAAGSILVASALWLRSSVWVRDLILRGKDTHELERMLSTDPKDPIARYYLAKNYYLARRFGEAAQAYREALDLDSTSVRAEIGLGLALAESGELRDARLAFERALTLDPRAAWPEYMLGKLAWQAGDVDEALRRTKRALELDPRSDQAWYGLAACFTQKRQYQDAIAALRNAVARNSRNAKAESGLGELLIYRGEGEEGRRHLERALELDASFAPACFLLGQYLSNNGSDPQYPDRAEELLRRAISLKSPRLYDAHLELGRLLIRKGRLAEAVKSYMKARELVPGDERSYRAMADAYRRMGQTDRAQKEDRQFAVISARHVRLQQLEARSYHNPEDTASSLELARLYVALNLKEKAARQYQSYLSARPNDGAAASEFRRIAGAAAADFSIAAPRE